MRSRDVVGRKVVAVHQYRSTSVCGTYTQHQAIELEGGVFLVPIVVDDCGCKMYVRRPSDPVAYVNWLREGNDPFAYMEDE